VVVTHLPHEVRLVLRYVVLLFLLTFLLLCWRELQ
jgi:hypothetical protein